MKKRLLAGLATGILLCCCNGMALATPYTGADITLNGNDTTDQSDRWFDVDGTSLYTAWANESVTYSAYLDVGNWNIGLNVTNHGNLEDSWYDEFLITNSLTSETIVITASANEIFSNYININITSAGTYTITYTWTNDKYDSSRGLDANIEILSAFFDDTSTTSYTGYNGTAPVPEPATMLLFGTGLVGLAGLSKKRNK